MTASALDYTPADMKIAADGHVRFHGTGTPEAGK